jgi:hypothetical protein
MWKKCIEMKGKKEIIGKKISDLQLSNLCSLVNIVCMIASMRLK